MQVYVSHSRENASVALRLCDLLAKRDIQTWLDVRDLELGTDSTHVIQHADAWLFLIGPGPNDQSQRLEWQQIIEQDSYLDPSRALIPIVIGSPEVPGFLTVRQYIHLDPTSIDFEETANKVVEALNKPADTIDAAKLQRGRDARERARKDLQEYVRNLGEEDLKRAGLRGLK